MLKSRHGQTAALLSFFAVPATNYKRKYQYVFAHNFVALNVKKQAKNILNISIIYLLFIYEFGPRSKKKFVHLWLRICQTQAKDEFDCS
jgi:hypothetical protein